MFTIFRLAALALVFTVGCSPPASGPPEDDMAVYRGQERFGLSFEERMAVPAELSRLKADAAARADAIYDPFRSKEDAICNEELTAQLYDAAKTELLAQKSLTSEQLDEIIREYQLSLGGNLR